MSKSIENTDNLTHSELGKKSEYLTQYSPDLLFPISRQSKRDEINIKLPLPFYGYDVWNHYEVSWLNLKGKPMVAIAEITYGCDSVNIIESKSMKLYFNSFNQTKFASSEAIAAIIQQDIADRVKGDVSVNVRTLPCDETVFAISELSGICIDTLDVECSVYQTDANLLKTSENHVNETVYSNLLKSNCLVTLQPDWGSVQISYEGKQIIHESLLQYLVSFRNHNEFHEQCIERIFIDIMRHCQPKNLTVLGRYTRRGGLDINPLRSTQPVQGIIKNSRLCRQ